MAILAGTAACLLLGAADCDTERPNRGPKVPDQRPSGSPEENMGPAPAVPVLGQFCTIDDSGKERLDSHNRTLVCRRDGNGVFKWQLRP